MYNRCIFVIAEGGGACAVLEIGVLGNPGGPHEEGLRAQEALDPILRWILRRGPISPRVRKTRGPHEESPRVQEALDPIFRRISRHGQNSPRVRKPRGASRKGPPSPGGSRPDFSSHHNADESSNAHNCREQGCLCLPLPMTVDTPPLMLTPIYATMMPPFISIDCRCRRTNCHPPISANPSHLRSFRHWMVGRMLLLTMHLLLLLIAGRMLLPLVGRVLLLMLHLLLLVGRMLLLVGRILHLLLLVGRRVQFQNSPRSIVCY